METRCADCGDLLTTEEEIRHGACNSCYAMAVYDWDREETWDRLTEGGYGSG